MNNKVRIVTEDNNYIIELERKISIFQKDRALCNITFKNIYEKIIASINISDIEIVNFIDNFYAFYDIGSDIIYSFNPDSINNIIYSIGFNVLQNNDQFSFDNCTKDICTLYSYNSQLETNTKILSFEITNSAEMIINLLYETFIEPNDYQMQKYLLNL